MGVGGWYREWVGGWKRVGVVVSVDMQPCMEALVLNCVTFQAQYNFFRLPHFEIFESEM